MVAHYLNPILISSCVLVFLFWFRNGIKNRFGKLVWLYFIVFVSIYLAIISAVLCKEFILIMRLEEFDLNNDGVFTGEEITAEQKDAMMRIAKDTARKLSVFTGLIFSGIITIPLFLMHLMKICVWNRYIKKTKA